MQTYKGHYDVCRGLYTGKKDDSKYSSLYDLVIDENILELNEIYYSTIEKLSKKIANKLDHGQGCYSDGQAIRLNEWRDIEEVSELAEIIMPQIEEKIFHSNLAVEFVHPYRNLHSAPVESSWKWHYDDCPKEFLKLFVYLNEVTEENGCLQVLQEPNKEFYVIESSRIGPQHRGAPQRPQKYQASRIPEEVIQETVNRGGSIYNLTGAPGKYALFTPNMAHRATIPKQGTNPRDLIVFFLRPCISERKYISEKTHSYIPERNVKMYPLD